MIDRRVMVTCAVTFLISTVVNVMWTAHTLKNLTAGGDDFIRAGVIQVQDGSGFWIPVYKEK